MSRTHQILHHPERLRAMLALADFDGYEIEKARREYQKNPGPHDAFLSATQDGVEVATAIEFYLAHQ